MATTVSVPAYVVRRLRRGANLQVAYAADEIASSVLALQKDAPPHEDRRKLDRLWALLDAIGWTGIVPDSIELDLAEHSLALLMAIDKVPLHMHEPLSGRFGDDEHKPGGTDHVVRELEGAARRAVARIEPTAVLTVPPVLVRGVREGAYRLLAVAAEAILKCGQAQAQPEPASRTHLERAWGLLGRLGWTTEKDTGQAVELDIAEHGVALHASIEAMIALLVERLAELDPASTSRDDRADELRLLRQLAVKVRRAITSE
jgi:hypothetical protein